MLTMEKDHIEETKMGKKNDTICDWKKKDIKGNIQKLKPLVNEPKFICTKCGRAANFKKNLCKGTRL